MMNDIPADVPAPTQRFILGYRVVLGTLALLALGGYLIMQLTLSRHSTDAHQINLAGRQLMLAQRISKAALILAHTPQSATWNAAHTEFEQAYNEWRDAQPLVESGNRTQQSRQLPAQPAQLTAVAVAFDDTIRAFLRVSASDTDVPTRQPAADRLVAAGDAFLAQMEPIVAAYDQDAQAHVDEMQRNALIILLLTLLAIGLQGWLIFRPLGRQLQQTIAKLVQSHAAIRDREERFRRLADASFEGIALHDHDRIVDANASLATMFGTPVDTLRALPLTALMTTESRRVVQARIQAGDEDMYEAVAVRSDGSEFPIEVQGKSIGIAGQPLRITVLRDISERKAVEQTLRQQAEALHAVNQQLQQRMHEVALLNELADLLQTCHSIEEAESVLALTMQDLFPSLHGSLYRMDGATLRPVSAWGSSLPPALEDSACRALQHGKPYYVAAGQHDGRCLHNQQLTSAAFCVPLMVRGTARGLLTLHAPDGVDFATAEQQLATTFADYVALAITNLQVRADLQQQSERDPLTGLANRRMLSVTLDAALADARRAHQSVGVLMLDIDHYKRFNDTYGHAAGDAVLRQLASWLQSQIRTGDTICRYGGEEFTIIFPNALLAVVAQRAEQLRQAVQAVQFTHEGQALGQVTLSFGVAVFPAHGTNASAVVAAADAALYEAKRGGRNRVVVAAAAASDA